MPLVTEKVFEKIGKPQTLLLNGVPFDLGEPATDKIQAKIFAIQSSVPSVVARTSKENVLFPFHVYHKRLGF